MDFVQILGGGLVGVIGTYLAVRRDARDVDAKARLEQEKRDDALVDRIEKRISSEMRVVELRNEHIKAIAQTTQDAVSLLNQTIENKLATKQEMAMLTMRLEGAEMRLSTVERDMRETQLACARHRSKETTAVRKESV